MVGCQKTSKVLLDINALDEVSRLVHFWDNRFEFVQSWVERLTETLGVLSALGMDRALTFGKPDQIRQQAIRVGEDDRREPSPSGKASFLKVSKATSVISPYSGRVHHFIIEESPGQVDGRTIMVGNARRT